MNTLKINVGSGNLPLVGFVNIDVRHSEGVDVIADVHHLPFAKTSVSEIYASSILEHFDDPYPILNEFHRVMQADAVLTVRVPSIWGFTGHLDKTHVFLADLKLWRQILNGYFQQVRVVGEGVQYRDNKLLVAINHVLVKVLAFNELAQTWRLTCRHKVDQPVRAYVPWWLEERYGHTGH